METKIQKWGNSLAVRLPKTIITKKALTEGTRVLITEQDDSILIQSARENTETLPDLLKRISKDNLHLETDWGKPQGKESW